ncbi:hypothetical protein AAMO2058_000437200 [Amorphochlora amoebiformis]|uniref:RRM domain-containing protein n=1 Tax=Amorphochlora amoebiformis TaxID=1561963 RepID=A0A7S0DCT3_9EUKA|mmetsp:Transcript_23667/g.37237  ORF Transcript_23667/g.37237 Transcript_23667/m.37237 type:complete len:240 (+) Transcript_23667:389-1108(+)
MGKCGGFNPGIGELIPHPLCIWVGPTRPKFLEPTEVHASKALKKKGQAWVVFDDFKSADRCVKEMQGFNFYDKPMRVAFSKIKSDIIAKRDGTFIPRPQKPSKRRKKDKKRAKPETKDKKMNGKKSKTNGSAPPAPAAAPPSIQAMGAGRGPPRASFPPRQASGPNRILFAENLPQDYKPGQLESLFSKLPGYREVRFVPGRNVAFIEFDNDYLAGVAMAQNANCRIGGNVLQVTYAKQ